MIKKYFIVTGKFYHIFLKKSRQNEKNVVLYKKLQGGDNIQKLINIFFITFIINFFVSIYTIYLFFEIKIFQKEQGLKLKIKKLLNEQNKEE